MSDYIERYRVKAYFSVLLEQYHKRGIPFNMNQKRLERIIDTIPAADVITPPGLDMVPKIRGEWMYDLSNHCFVCSRCKRELDTSFCFCPHCGADLRPVKIV